MTNFRKLALGVVMACLLSPICVLAQNSIPVRGLTNSFPFLGDLSVVGPDGIFYRAASVPLEARGGPGVVPSSPASKLEAFNLDANAKDPFDVLYFSDYATHLDIGKDRLFLIASVPSTPTFTDSRGLGSPVPQPSIKSKLFIIPIPFPAVRSAGATLESIATGANSHSGENSKITDVSPALTNVVQVELAGPVSSLEVKAVGNREYLYIVTADFLAPVILGTGTGAPTTPGRPTLSMTSKLTILDSDGNRIKVIDLK